MAGPGVDARAAVSRSVWMIGGAGAAAAPSNGKPVRQKRTLVSRNTCSTRLRLSLERRETLVTRERAIRVGSCSKSLREGGASDSRAASATARGRRIGVSAAESWRLRGGLALRAERSTPLIWKGALSIFCAFVFVRTGFYIAG